MPLWVGQLLAPIIERLLGRIFDGLVYVGKKIHRTLKRWLNGSEISKQVKRVEEAKLKAFDGQPLTKEQEEELDEAVSDLIRDF